MGDGKSELSKLAAVATRQPCEKCGEAAFFIEHATMVPVTPGIANAVPRLKDALGGEFIVLQALPAGTPGAVRD